MNDEMREKIVFRLLVAAIVLAALVAVAIFVNVLDIFVPYGR